MMLEERVAEVLARYELEILRSYRVRGAYVLETRQGLYLYRSYSGTETRASQEAAIQQCLMDRGFERVDRYLASTTGEFLGIDAMGEAHVVKRWYQGEECNLREPLEAERAAQTLAEMSALAGQMNGLANKAFAASELLNNTFVDVPARESQIVIGQIKGICLPRQRCAFFNFKAVAADMLRRKLYYIG